MKGFLSARSDYFIGYATVAAIVGSDGAKTSLEGCVAKMVVLTDGKNAAQVLAIAPPSEFEKAVLQSDSYDWVERWRRVRIYHAPDESQEFAKASKRVERVLDRILKQHTAHADPSVAESVFEEALVKKRVPDKCGDGDVKLEIADVNALDADELEHLLAQVPNEWKPIIKTSGPKDYVVEVEGQYIHEDTRSWWLTPTFAKGVGVFGLGVVSGVGLAALARVHVQSYSVRCCNP
ncbi:hypothetical protein GNI_090180 [Gregarina niphandrodes]|uniref:Uncharacterized protein n=1 Tax=Gregarina niphandrodes TaxID=110365 RepID=A0A023B5I7_GRENI|nr:hypothetical protein GNI_090180 [Gregarina niphandrodes]EZG60585.1 hypothetical protein GNI_090180 [Gregarina niphandrodes]|eukprot:XP_011130823.1 hypothetical protein GNI_090180 [Gregarina niphandrodes]